MSRQQQQEGKKYNRKNAGLQKSARGYFHHVEKTETMIMQLEILQIMESVR